MSQLGGVIVPVLTPIHQDETPNYEQLRTLVDYVIDGGVNAIFANGTTGEFARFHEDEQAKCLQTIVEQANHRVQVIGVVSACGTRLVIDNAKAAEAAGADFIATTLPYYFPSTSLKEQIQFLEDVTSSVSVPVILYNIPIALGFGVSSDVLDEVAGLDNLYGIKDTGSGKDFLDLLLLKYHDRLKVFVGDESLFYHGLSNGADGIVPSMANPFPRLLARGWKASQDKDWETCRKCFEQVDDMNLLNKFSDSWMGSNIWRKEALHQMNIIDPYFTRPNTALTDKERAEIAEFIQRYHEEF